MLARHILTTSVLGFSLLISTYSANAGSSNAPTCIGGVCGAGSDCSQRGNSSGNCYVTMTNGTASQCTQANFGTDIPAWNGCTAPNSTTLTPLCPSKHCTILAPGDVTGSAVTAANVIGCPPKSQVSACYVYTNEETNSPHAGFLACNYSNGNLESSEYCYHTTE